MKKVPPSFDDLKTAILWKPYPDVEGDPYDDEFVQIQLKARLAALLKKYGISFSDYPGAWPTVKPGGNQPSHFCFGTQKVNPFYNLAVALACEHVKGMQIARKKVGRPGKQKEHLRQMYDLAKRIKKGLQNGDSESTIISNVVKDKKTFGDLRKTSLERRWKEFKSEKDEDTGMTNGDRLGIPSSKKRKLAAEKRKAIKEASH